MITMYDAVTIENIPGSATVVAGYVDGTKVRPNFKPLCENFPHATHLPIAVFAHDDADCLDVELGDARPDQVPDWYHRQKARGVARPVIYADLTRMKQVLDVLSAHNIARSSVRLWSAHYPESLDKLQALGKEQLEALNNRWAHICGPHPDGCGQIGIAMDGTQFTNWAHSKSLDQSLLRDDFFGPAQPQVQPPPVSVFIAEGGASLNDLAQKTLHNAVSTILRLTAEHTPGGKFHEGTAGYLNGVFAHDTEKVPEGVTVFHRTGNGAEPFVSSGHQTLQGLALAFQCQPSDIVQLTAEQSPGAVFSGGMAQYLDDVFGRSATPVPKGAHLFYQK
jgi:hypothetical protein